MFKNAKKVDLQIAATELGEVVTEKMTIIELTNMIKSTEVFKNEPDYVSDLISEIIENRKTELETVERNKERELQLEQLKLERMQAELELARVQKELRTKDASSEIISDNCDSLDSLIKSVRTLTIKIPSRPEGWGLFFNSLERSFVTKKVPDNYKSEILLNLLGEKASNIISYINDNELNDYEKIKKIVLREFEPTPQSCLEQFRKTIRQSNETHVQFASRLTTSYDYYLKLREVSNFDKLKKLIVADKLFQTLDKETAAHISVRQSDTWFDPIKLAKEVDLYFVSRGKPLSVDNKSLNQKNVNSRNVSRVLLSDAKSLKCILCSENHPLHKCSIYMALPVSDRVDVIKKNNYCFNCLGKHLVTKCRSSFSCYLCEREGRKKRHHFSLHYPRNSENIQSANGVGAGELISPSTSVAGSSLSPLATPFQGNENTPVLSSRVINHAKTVLLSTVRCLIKDERGVLYNVRAILDQGAMNNYITADCANSLGLRKDRTNMTVCGIGDTTTTIKSVVTTTLSNLDRNFEKELDFLVVSRITDFMPSKILKVNIPELKHVQLADESFNRPSRVDLLLSAEIFYELLRPGQIYPINSNLILQNTVFGYVVSGSLPSDTEGKVHCGFIQDNTTLIKAVEKFWEIENVEIEVPKLKEAISCEEHFVKNVKRDITGRYIVKMPLKEDPVCLGKSKDIALKKLNSLWNRFLREPEYLELYKGFLREYEELGHMKEISEFEEEVGTYYIPHLGVYRPDKSTTKLRVVFNASSKTTLGNSLNSLQYNGGVLQEDLFSIMVRFRKHVFAFVADIKQMYRMILIDPSQTKLQRILWREGVNEPVKTYELKTVTYGTVSAPHLATRVLIQLAKDEGEHYPLASAVLQRDFYMDDVLSGADSLTEAKELQSELIDALKRGGMTLHKWCSNNGELKLSEETSNSDYKFQEETKALGVSWKHSTDHFTFQIQLENMVPPTKRSVLSTIARIFDPLGLLGPVVTRAKIFLQKLWCLNLNWSDPLPELEAQQWRDFVESLPTINKISVERCIVMEKSINIELHGFADASESAYGCVIYCKSSSETGEFKVSLICSKSRVSPLKRTTIPRLELCAAVLLAKLMSKVMCALQLKANDVYLWSDSMITLSWIRKEPYLLKTFVANRVATIQELTPVQQWRHVSSENNPADLISRGIDPDKLIKSELWFNGPTFLTDQEYPNREIPSSVIRDEFTSELKQSKQSDFPVLTVTSNPFVQELINISNSYTKIIHVLSYVFRFVHNVRNSAEKRLGPLSTEEFKHSEFFIVKEVQKLEFPEEHKCLSNQKCVPDKSKISCLNPFIDNDGLLRVGGRLKHSNVKFDKKFPILLPSSHKLSQIIAEYYHIKYLHTGPNTLLYYLREKFWIVNGRNVCRKVVHKCVICFKANPKSAQQVMGNLPRDRVVQNYPFNISGVDFCGPFFIKYKNQRKGTYNKIYVAIFVCFVTKAIHLEIVTDLTSAAFLAALKRFISRRGKCSKLYTDNAKTFVGANAELKKLSKLITLPDDLMARYMSSENIDWQFSPPRAPNFGGLWEAGVKSFKYYLKRAAGNLKLTYEEFLTLITQVEGMLNSRPLVPLTADMEDLNALTPAHFLVGRSLTSIIDPDLTAINENRLSQWQKITKLFQCIWRKWHSDYLCHLQQRTRWRFEKKNIRRGDMVILKEDNLPPCEWSLGRISDIYPGDDKKVRVAEVKTSAGKFKRPITKLCILPINN